MILIKDNYFGSFTHFRTFGELVDDWDKVPKVFGDRVEEKYRPGKVRRSLLGVHRNDPDNVECFLSPMFLRST